MVFCNSVNVFDGVMGTVVTILILIDGFLQYDNDGRIIKLSDVTILILIDGFLQ